jgi:DNA-binding response OmpR family regulator
VDSPRVLLIAKETDDVRGLVEGLTHQGFTCAIITDEEELESSPSVDLVFLVTDINLNGSDLNDLTQQIKRGRGTHIILLADDEVLRHIDTNAFIDDFILEPFNLQELSTRINRLLKRHRPKEAPEDFLKSGDIVIDLARCEVSVAGRTVDLTFTEYELLKLLMSKKGHVFTRETLLNKVWGYDYFGGDRTVDVHITRLRSKIEDPSHSFIETVRNIGYRIKDNDK